MGHTVTYAEKKPNEVCLVRKRECMERTDAAFTKHLEKNKIRLNSAWFLQHSLVIYYQHMFCLRNFIPQQYTADAQNTMVTPE